MDDWEEHFSERRQKKYWKNKTTGESTWVSPFEAQSNMKSSVPSASTERINATSSNNFDGNAAESKQSRTVSDENNIWVEAFSEKRNRKYWKNKLTGESTWIDPHSQLPNQQPANTKELSSSSHASLNAGAAGDSVDSSSNSAQAGGKIKVFQSQNSNYENELVSKGESTWDNNGTLLSTDSTILNSTSNSNSATNKSLNEKKSSAPRPTPPPKPPAPPPLGKSKSTSDSVGANSTKASGTIADAQIGINSVIRSDGSISYSTTVFINRNIAFNNAYSYVSPYSMEVEISQSNEVSLKFRSTTVLFSAASASPGHCIPIIAGTDVLVASPSACDITIRFDIEKVDKQLAGSINYLVYNDTSSFMNKSSETFEFKVTCFSAISAQCLATILQRQIKILNENKRDKSASNDGASQKNLYNFEDMTSNSTIAINSREFNNANILSNVLQISTHDCSNDKNKIFNYLNSRKDSLNQSASRILDIGENTNRVANRNDDITCYIAVFKIDFVGHDNKLLSESKTRVRKFSSEVGNELKLFGVTTSGTPNSSEIIDKNSSKHAKKTVFLTSKNSPESIKTRQKSSHVFNYDMENRWSSAIFKIDFDKNQLLLFCNNSNYPTHSIAYNSFQDILFPTDYLNCKHLEFALRFPKAKSSDKLENNKYARRIIRFRFDTINEYLSFLNSILLLSNPSIGRVYDLSDNSNKSNIIINRDSLNFTPVCSVLQSALLISSTRNLMQSLGHKDLNNNSNITKSENNSNILNVSDLHLTCENNRLFSSTTRKAGSSSLSSSNLILGVNDITINNVNCDVLKNMLISSTNTSTRINKENSFDQNITTITYISNGDQFHRVKLFIDRIDQPAEDLKYDRYSQSLASSTNYSNQSLSKLNSWIGGYFISMNGKIHLIFDENPLNSVKKERENSITSAKLSLSCSTTDFNYRVNMNTDCNFSDIIHKFASSSGSIMKHLSNQGLLALQISCPGFQVQISHDDYQSMLNIITFTSRTHTLSNIPINVSLDIVNMSSNLNDFYGNDLHIYDFSEVLHANNRYKEGFYSSLQGNTTSYCLAVNEKNFVDSNSLSKKVAPILEEENNLKYELFILCEKFQNSLLHYDKDFTCNLYDKLAYPTSSIWQYEKSGNHLLEQYQNFVADYMSNQYLHAKLLHNEIIASRKNLPQEVILSSEESELLNNVKKALSTDIVDLKSKEMGDTMNMSQPSNESVDVSDSMKLSMQAIAEASMSTPNIENAISSAPTVTKRRSSVLLDLKQSIMNVPTPSDTLSVEDSLVNNEDLKYKEEEGFKTAAAPKKSLKDFKNTISSVGKVMVEVSKSEKINVNGEKDIIGFLPEEDRIAILQFINSIRSDPSIIISLCSSFTEIVDVSSFMNIVVHRLFGPFVKETSLLLPKSFQLDNTSMGNFFIINTTDDRIRDILLAIIDNDKAFMFNSSSKIIKQNDKSQSLLQSSEHSNKPSKVNFMPESNFSSSYDIINFHLKSSSKSISNDSTNKMNDLKSTASKPSLQLNYSNAKFELLNFFLDEVSERFDVVTYIRYICQDAMLLTLKELARSSINGANRTMHVGIICDKFIEPVTLKLIRSIESNSVPNIIILTINELIKYHHADFSDIGSKVTNYLHCKAMYFVWLLIHNFIKKAMASYTNIVNNHNNELDEISMSKELLESLGMNFNSLNSSRLSLLRGGMIRSSNNSGSKNESISQIFDSYNDLYFDGIMAPIWSIFQECLLVWSGFSNKNAASSRLNTGNPLISLNLLEIATIQRCQANLSKFFVLCNENYHKCEEISGVSKNNIRSSKCEVSTECSLVLLPLELSFLLDKCLYSTIGYKIITKQAEDTKISLSFDATMNSIGFDSNAQLGTLAYKSLQHLLKIKHSLSYVMKDYNTNNKILIIASSSYYSKLKNTIKRDDSLTNTKDERRSIDTSFQNMSNNHSESNLTTLENQLSSISWIINSGKSILGTIKEHVFNDDASKNSKNSINARYLRSAISEVSGLYNSMLQSAPFTWNVLNAFSFISHLQEISCNLGNELKILTELRSHKIDKIDLHRDLTKVLIHNGYISKNEDEILSGPTLNNNLINFDYSIDVDRIQEFTKLAKRNATIYSEQEGLFASTEKLKESAVNKLEISRNDNLLLSLILQQFQRESLLSYSQYCNETHASINRFFSQKSIGAAFQSHDNSTAIYESEIQSCSVPSNIFSEDVSDKENSASSIPEISNSSADDNSLSNSRHLNTLGENSHFESKLKSAPGSKSLELVLKANRVSNQYNSDLKSTANEDNSRDNSVNSLYLAIKNVELAKETI